MTLEHWQHISNYLQTLLGCVFIPTLLHSILSLRKFSELEKLINATNGGK